MQSYFLRAADVSDVDPDTLLELWEQDRIAIHYPGNGAEDLRSLNPGDYATRIEKNAVRTFARLAREGGYVWAQCPGASYELVGKVEPKVQFTETTWARSRSPREGQAPRDPGSTAVLKVLPLVKAKRLGPSDLVSLRASRPRKAGLSEWQACGQRLAGYVEDAFLALEWSELSRDLQETAAAEYLRAHQHKELPRLEYLLLPVGRTLQDVDFHGMAEDGHEIYAQVGQGRPDFQEGTGKMGPLIRLRERKPESVRVLFADVPETENREGIWLVPTRAVFDWLMERPDYCNRLFML
jgi:hypothetical protein